jgi:hypothetical protein
MVEPEGLQRVPRSGGVQMDQWLDLDCSHDHFSYALCGNGYLMVQLNAIACSVHTSQLRVASVTVTRSSPCEPRLTGAPWCWLNASWVEEIERRGQGCVRRSHSQPPRHCPRHCLAGIRRCRPGQSETKNNACMLPMIKMHWHHATLESLETERHVRRNRAAASVLLCVRAPSSNQF